MFVTGCDMPRAFGPLIGELVSRYETAAFVFHFALRSPFSSSGEGGTRRGFGRYSVHGVRSMEYVQSLATMFESALRKYCHQLGYRAPLGCGAGKKLDVYVYSLPRGAEAVAAVLGTPDVREALVGITNRCERPSGWPDTDRLRAAVAHVLFHAIVLAYRLPGGTGDPWAWWYEATATSMEDVVFPGSTENLEFVAHCFDQCDRPLDLRDGVREYASFLFCKRLAETIGLDVIRRIWERSDQFKSALQAIDDELRHSAGLPLASSQAADFFASHFSVANAFPDDAQHGYASGHVYAEAGQHAFIKCAVSRFPATIEDEVDHLGCHYYYFQVPRKKRNLTFRLEVPRQGDSQNCPLKGIAVAVSRRHPELRIREIFLSPTADHQRARAQLMLRDLQSKSATGVVLIVANCSWGAEQADSVAYRCSVRQS